MKIVTIIVTCLLFTTVSFAELCKPGTMMGLNKEAQYVDKWCKDIGDTEVIMSDKTRCDCLTEHFAIEFDYAYKWYEGITQALHYAELTGKNPGLVLILKCQNDIRYYEKTLKIINRRNLPIQVWVIKVY